MVYFETDIHSKKKIVNLLTKIICLYEQIAKYALMHQFQYTHFPF